MANTTDEPFKCSQLAFRTSFEAYIDKIQNVTTTALPDSKQNQSAGLAGNETCTDYVSILQPCKSEVCSALWGSTNTDIVGEGVTSSYFVAIILSFLLTALVIVQLRLTLRLERPPFTWDVHNALLRCGNTLHICVLWLCISIQIASIILLVKVNFGLNAVGMEFPTMEITWSVSILVVLPLIPLTFLSKRSNHLHQATSSRGQSRSMFELEPYLPSMQSSVTLPEPQSGPKLSTMRLRTYTLAWFLSIYPFLSRLLETFAPNKIGTGKGKVISDTCWNEIKRLCHEGVTGPTNSERMAMTAFGIIGWIWITMAVAPCLVILYLKRRDPDSIRLRNYERSMNLLIKAEKGAIWYSRYGVVGLILVASTIVATGNLWGIFRLLRYQRDIDISAGGEEQERIFGQWGFGQIVAIMVFAPVAASICKVIGVMWKGSRYNNHRKTGRSRSI